VVAAHYNHRLRPEAANDADQVQRIAERMGVPFVSDSKDVGAVARAEGMSVEEAARTMRYRFLFAEAHRLECAAVAVGHTADDQVETVLMHFLRGAGLAGLRGMLACGVITEWDSAIPLVRPLLGVWREEVMDYCKSYALDPVFDQSNLDTTYFRNRLRHELIPYLQGYNPQIKDVVWRMSQAVAGDYEILAGVIQAGWQDSRIEEGSDFVVLSLPVLRKMERGLRRSVVRMAINYLRPGLRDIDFQSIDRAAHFIDTPTQRRSMDLVANLILYISGERIFIGDHNSSLLLQEWPQIAAGEIHELPVPGRLELHDRWILESRWLEGSEIKKMSACTAGPFQACLDAACLSLPLQVRTRRPGDRFRPLGMGGIHSSCLTFGSTNNCRALRVPVGRWYARTMRFCGFLDTARRRAVDFDRDTPGGSFDLKTSRRLI
jgi:tRNA(Ile)-lysidine synthase